MNRLIALITIIVSVSSAGMLSAQELERFVRYSQNGGEIFWGMVHDDEVYQLAGAPYNTMEHTGVKFLREDVKLEAPVEPARIFMTGLNFYSHISGDPAETPALFIVPANSLVGPEDPIIRPAGSENLHYEAEMAIVIGKRAENVTVEEASDYIFGVTAGNDVSERDWQAGDFQIVRAKGSRGFNAVGPELVKGVDYKNVEITGRLNGEIVQGENSSDLIFGMEKMVSYISTYFTLEPGDMIWSGTMGSTSAMVPGDVYEVEIEDVGILRNEVVQGR
ncbi:MAG: fumarylacetoacetate hydrolase family protein [Gammaproteobacteria bacterium]|nr:fumarylacetoacetate hydrolase family protein [Gammaproteobacteria bacterium]